MRVAALLGLLAALPAHAGDAVTPARARASVVSALPADIAKGAGSGDLRAYLERLTPAQKKAALRALAEEEERLGDDPATLAVIGQAYAGLGRVQEARQAAEAALRQNPNDPDAKRLLGWVVAKENLAERGAGGGTFGGVGGPAPAAAGRQETLDVFERRIQGAFRRGRRSAEFQDTLSDARGMSVAELAAAGITFQHVDAGQKDAVVIIQQGKSFTISLRDDALDSRGDAEARAAAHVANGVRQVQTKRDHPLIGGAIILARGWFTAATTHKQLAPNDRDRNPSGPSDQNLMAARKMLDLKAERFEKTDESYGGENENGALDLFNSLVNRYGPEVLLERFMVITERVKENADNP